MLVNCSLGEFFSSYEKFKDLSNRNIFMTKKNKKIESRKYVMRYIALLRDIWLIFGFSLLLLVSFEISCDLLLYLKTKPYVDERIKADGYKNAVWVEDYFKEFYSALSSGIWKSYVYVGFKPFSGQYINIDHNGLRLTSFPEIAEINDSKMLRIFMFGGSALWGTGARDSYTIPSLLGKFLSEHGVKAEITNFGQSGRVSTQEVIDLFLQLQKGNIPNIVIFYDGINDTFSAFQNGISGIPQNEWNRKKEFNLLKPSRYNDLNKFFLLSLFERSGIGRMIKIIKRRIICYHRSGTGPKPPFKMRPPVSKDILQHLGSEEEPQNFH